MRKQSNKWLAVASLLAFVAIWAVAARIAATRVLPGPVAVLEALVVEAQRGDLFYHLGITLARVSASFTVAMVIGVAIGVIMGRSKNIDRFFDSWLVLFLNLPALVTIILAYVWFGLIEASAILAVAVNKIPNVIVIVREGARALDKDLDEMTQVYQVNSLKKLRYVVMPQLSPYIFASARSGLALIWKIVLVVELLGRPNGVGFQLHLYFQLFDIAAILAYAVAFIFIVQLIEMFLMQPLEARINRWRR